MFEIVNREKIVNREYAKLDSRFTIFTFHDLQNREYAKLDSRFTIFTFHDLQNSEYAKLDSRFTIFTFHDLQNSEYAKLDSRFTIFSRLTLCFSRFSHDSRLSHALQNRLIHKRQFIWKIGCKMQTSTFMAHIGRARNQVTYSNKVAKFAKLRRKRSMIVQIFGFLIQ